MLSPVSETSLGELPQRLPNWVQKSSRSPARTAISIHSFPTRRSSDLEEFPGSTFYPGKKPWEQKVDIALPCATQNELDADDARKLIENKTSCVAEVSNMGCTAEAVDLFIEHKQLFAPGKAVNAGGVATSGLEMTQNAMHISWTAAEVDDKLHQIMSAIHQQCVEHGKEDQYINYVKGANIAGFMKVAKAMMAQGIV